MGGIELRRFKNDVKGKRLFAGGDVLADFELQFPCNGYFEISTTFKMTISIMAEECQLSGFNTRFFLLSCNPLRFFEQLAASFMNRSLVTLETSFSS